MLQLGQAQPKEYCSSNSRVIIDKKTAFKSAASLSTSQNCTVLLALASRRRHLVGLGVASTYHVAIRVHAAEVITQVLECSTPRLDGVSMRFTGLPLVMSSHFYQEALDLPFPEGPHRHRLHPLFNLLPFLGLS